MTKNIPAFRPISFVNFSWPPPFTPKHSNTFAFGSVNPVTLEWILWLFGRSAHVNCVACCLPRWMPPDVLKRRIPVSLNYTPLRCHCPLSLRRMFVFSHFLLFLFSLCICFFLTEFMFFMPCFSSIFPHFLLTTEGGTQWENYTAQEPVLLLSCGHFYYVHSSTAMSSLL